MLAFLCVVTVLIWAAYAIITRWVTLSWGVSVYAAMLFLRTGGLIGLSVLTWKVFWGREEEVIKRSPERTEPTVIVLQDGSASMEIPGAPGKTRDELAESVWTEVRERSRSAGPDVERYIFAENVVESAQAEALRRKGSRLSHALTGVLSRESLQSVLVVSDGASTDGLVPPFIIDWARNRNIRVHAICSAVPDLELFDRAIEDVVCEELNPSTLTAKIRCSGVNAKPLRISLAIDGALVAEVQRPPAETRDVLFRITEYEKGWHEYVVEIQEEEGETTFLNNRFHGVFQVERDGILLLYDRPHIETVHLARFLKNEFDDRFAVSSLGGLQDSKTDLRGHAIIILANVDPERIPAETHGKWLRGNDTILVIGEAGLKNWTAEGLPAFPIVHEGHMEFLGESGGSGGVVSLSPKFRAGGSLKKDQTLLPLDLLQRAKIDDNAQVLYQVETGQGDSPLVVASSTGEPRFVVCLTTTTWKWAVHPTPRVRASYAKFWSTCLDWAIRSSKERSPLVLELESREDLASGIRGWVALASTLSDSVLRNCLVTISRAGLIEEIPTAEDGGRHIFSYQRDPGQFESGVIWFQGMAELDGRTVTSERVPVALNQDLREFRRIYPDAKVLEQCTTLEKNGFSWYPGRGPVIDSLFRRMDAAPAELTIQRREPVWEFVLSGIAFLFLALEWWLERRLNDARTR